MNLLRITILSTLLLGFACTTTAQAESKAYLNSHNLPASGLALDGYCPVAYHAVNKPVKGKRDHAVEHDGVWYFFVSEEAKQMFVADPEKYLPACGGWCAFGMAIEDKFPVDPTNFKIINGKLHLFLKNTNIDARALWNQGDEAELIRKANAHWAKVSK